jgi:hypothetical protein
VGGNGHRWLSKHVSATAKCRVYGKAAKNLMAIITGDARSMTIIMKSNRKSI